MSEVYQIAESAYAAGVVVYCEGPADAPHPRRTIRCYMPASVFSTSGRQDRSWILLPNTPKVWDSDNVNWPVHHDVIELFCRDCRFDEKRRLDRAYGREYPPFSAVFEKLSASGVHEISVRALVGLVWPTKTSVRLSEQ